MSTIIEYLKPEHIANLFDAVRINLAEQAKVTTKLMEIKNALESKKSGVISGEGFIAEKNLPLQEGKFQSMFPGMYDEISDLEAKLKNNKDFGDLLRQTRDEYRMLIDYFAIDMGLK